MKSLTIAMSTARQNPMWAEWFLPSLLNQISGEPPITLMVIDALYDQRDKPIDGGYCGANCAPVMPNTFQGKYRLTPEDWWAVSSARNTAICMCKTDYLAFVDDRSVLSPNWLQCVYEAMAGDYIMAGSYEKRQNMKVEKGVIVDAGTLQAEDSRLKASKDKPIPCPGEWLFGCNLLFPLEQLLKINGYPALWTDSLSFEDCITGLVLANNGFKMKFDPRAHLIEDRTPSELGEPMKRTCWEKHPNDTNDKAHTVLKIARTAKKCENIYDIRKLRDSIQIGEPFPIATTPTVDWFNGVELKDFK